MSFWTVLIFLSSLTPYIKGDGQCVKKTYCDANFYQKGPYYDRRGHYHALSGCERDHLLDSLECRNLTNLDATGTICNRNGNCERAVFLNSTITHLPIKGFNSLLVKELYMKNTHLETMKVGCFSGLELLKVLHLENNKLKEINRGVFNALFDLEELHLENNLISLVEDNAFLGNFQLSQLYLGHNQIQNISSQMFSRLRLRILDVSYNQLTVFNLNISHCFYLSKLYINHNKIITITSNLPPNLNDLDASENKLTDLGPISKLSELTTLYINDNKLNNIPAGAMKSMKNLARLNISHNAISELYCGTLTGMENVINFDISYNDLNIFDEKAFYALKSIQILNISFTNITQFSVKELADHCKNLNQISMFGIHLTCLELSEIIIEADLKNITVNEGIGNENDHTISISCKKTKPDLHSRTVLSTDENRVKNYFEKLFGKNLAKLIGQNSTLTIKYDYSDLEAKTDEFKIFLEKEFRNSSFFKYIEHFSSKPKNDSNDNFTQSTMILNILKNISVEQKDVSTYTRNSNIYLKKMFELFAANFKNVSLYKFTVLNDTSANDLKFGRLINTLEQLVSKQNIQSVPAQSQRLENDVSVKIESSLGQLKSTMTVLSCLFFVICLGTIVFKMFTKKSETKTASNSMAASEMEVMEN